MTTKNMMPFFANVGVTPTLAKACYSSTINYFCSGVGYAYNEVHLLQSIWDAQGINVSISEGNV